MTDQTHAVLAALDEQADKGRPGRGLIVVGAGLEPEDQSLDGVRHADRAERRHRHDSACLAKVAL